MENVLPIAVLFGGILVCFFISRHITHMIRKKFHRSAVIASTLTLIPIFCISTPKVNSLAVEFLSLNLKTAQRQKQVNDLETDISTNQKLLSETQLALARAQESKLVDLAIKESSKANGNPIALGGFYVLPLDRAKSVLPDITWSKFDNGSTKKKWLILSPKVFSIRPAASAYDASPIRVHDAQTGREWDVPYDRKSLKNAIEGLAVDPRTIQFDIGRTGSEGRGLSTEKTDQETKSGGSE